MTLNTCGGYSADDCGYSGAFGWTRHALYPGKWLVICFEETFAKELTSFAVTDDFGNLVRVPS